MDLKTLFDVQGKVSYDVGDNHTVSVSISAMLRKTRSWTSAATLPSSGSGRTEHWNHLTLHSTRR